MPGTEIIVLWEPWLSGENWTSLTMVENYVQAYQESVPVDVTEKGRCDSCGQRIGKVVQKPDLDRPGTSHFVAFVFESEIMEPRCLPCQFKTSDVIMKPTAFDIWREPSTGQHTAEAHDERLDAEVTA